MRFKRRRPVRRVHGAVLGGLCRFQQYGLDTLRTGIMAGSTCPEEVMRRVRQEMHMRDVTICYGMTETSPVSFQTSPTGDWPRW